MTKEPTGEDRPTISVVIPTHNRASLLTRALDSVMAQTLEAVEVIVVDDGSTDDTTEVLERYPAVERIHLPVNRGGGTARNIGVEASRAPLVAFLDSDDEWLPHKLERQVDLFHGRPQLGAAYCRFFAHDDRTGVRREQHPPLYRGKIRDVLLSGRCPRTTSLFVVRREAFEGVGGFDASLPGFQDTDLWIRMSEDWEFDAVDEPLAIVHSHSGPRITTDVEARREALDAFLAKWGADMELMMGTSGVNRYRRNQMAVALGAKVLEQAARRDRVAASAALGEYLAASGIRRPAQFAGLLVAIAFGSSAHERAKRWKQRVR
jgi:glycosyltransferase involved in cell wall biosynthesis